MIKILLTASNPAGTTRLDLDEELRAIAERMQKARGHDQFELISALAVRRADFIQLVQRHRPTLVHFSGHGNPSGELVLRDDDRGPAPSPIESIAEVFGILAKETGIRGVVLNACFSEPQARAIAEHVDFAVGTRRAVKDSAAIEFASQFYSSLGFGSSVPEAFNRARAQLAIAIPNLSRFDVPQLIARESQQEQMPMAPSPGGTFSAGKAHDAPSSASPRPAAPRARPLPAAPSGESHLEHAGSSEQFEGATRAATHPSPAPARSAVPESRMGSMGPAPRKRRAVSARRSATGASRESRVYLNAWLNGDRSARMRVRQRRELLLTVGAWDERNALKGIEAVISKPPLLSPFAEFRFVVQCPGCRVSPLRPMYAYGSPEPALFEIEPISAAAGPSTIVIVVLRERAVLHVAHLDVEIIDPRPVAKVAP